jgi:hypothetical protein
MNAIQEALVGYRHVGAIFTHPLLAEGPQHPLRDVRRLSGVPHKKLRYMKRRSGFPAPQGGEFGA